MKKICLHLATIGPVGYFMAPGTVASILAIPLVYTLKLYTCGSELLYTAIVAGLTCIAIAIIFFAHQVFHAHHDPSEIVLDEVIGCLFAFVGIPFTVQSAIMGLILFRIFDISKRFGISHFEKFPGAIGIIFDDIIAGIFTAFILQFIIQI